MLIHIFPSYSFKWLHATLTITVTTMAANVYTASVFQVLYILLISALKQLCDQFYIMLILQRKKLTQITP